MWKHVIAFCLGLLSFLLLMFVGETAGLPAAGAAAAVYFCLCQFLLSRGNIGAHRDWSLMLTLDAVTLLVTVGMIITEKRPVILSQAPVFLLIPCGATYLGALLASLAVRRRGRPTAEEV
jgi:hypothetical protein